MVFTICGSLFVEKNENNVSACFLKKTFLSSSYSLQDACSGFQVAARDYKSCSEKAACYSENCSA
jgi:hypothetical protein